MGTTTLSSQHTGTIPAGIRTGVALAATLAVFYALGTLAWLAAPGSFLNFTNGLFRGMDFSALIRPAPFSWPGFLEALVVMTVWGFLAGTFFSDG
jgi:hypothetical protein